MLLVALISGSVLTSANAEGVEGIQDTENVAVIDDDYELSEIENDILPESQNAGIDESENSIPNIICQVDLLYESLQKCSSISRRRIW